MLVTVHQCNNWFNIPKQTDGYDFTKKEKNKCEHGYSRAWHHSLFPDFISSLRVLSAGEEEEAERYLSY